MNCPLLWQAWDRLAASMESLLFLADTVEERTQAHESTDTDPERGKIHQADLYFTLGETKEGVGGGAGSGCPSVMPKHKPWKPSCV